MENVSREATVKVELTARVGARAGKKSNQTPTMNMKKIYELTPVLPIRE